MGIARHLPKVTVRKNDRFRGWISKHQKGGNQVDLRNTFEKDSICEKSNLLENGENAVLGHLVKATIWPCDSRAEMCWNGLFPQND